MATGNALSFDEFQGFLSDALQVSLDTLRPDASFLNDLAVDSLKMVEMVLRIESRLGVSIPPDAAWSIQTVRDAYDFYAEQIGESSAAA